MVKCQILFIFFLLILSLWWSLLHHLTIFRNNAKKRISSFSFPYNFPSSKDFLNKHFQHVAPRSQKCLKIRIDLLKLAHDHATALISLKIDLFSISSFRIYTNTLPQHLLFHEWQEFALFIRKSIDRFIVWNCFIEEYFENVCAWMFCSFFMRHFIEVYHFILYCI